MAKYYVERSLKKTIRCYLENVDWLDNIILGVYQNYYGSVNIERQDKL